MGQVYRAFRLLDFFCHFSFSFFTLLLFFFSFKQALFEAPNHVFFCYDFGSITARNIYYLFIFVVF